MFWWVGVGLSEYMDPLPNLNNRGGFMRKRRDLEEAVSTINLIILPVAGRGRPEEKEEEELRRKLDGGGED
ncbi:unnamed protein product [Linum trigynum]|uniref:Uncharacterized protein n=1 Tax=Linum trigynum TaxID=586398 RepID=A0AAV2E6P3_9ROSI